MPFSAESTGTDLCDLRLCLQDEDARTTSSKITDKLNAIKFKVLQFNTRSIFQIMYLANN